MKGQVLIDEYGDNIQATVLAGDHYRTRHDAFKHHVSDACRWVGNGHGVRRGGAQPVFRADTALQQQGLSRAEKARQYQGIVPDLRIKMPGVGRGQGQGAPGLPAGGLAGQASSVLHEVKVISSSRTRYNPTWQKRAVDVRADQLQGEYVTKAGAADRRQNGPEAGVGRVEQKLLSLGPIQGIVAGQFGEVSEATHSLFWTPWPPAGSAQLAQVLAGADFPEVRSWRVLRTGFARLT